MEGSGKKNEEIQEEINRKRKINNIRYHLGKVEKIQEEFDEVQKLLLEKINTLLQKEDWTDTLINTSKERWNNYLRIRGNDKDESTRMLNS
jgi:Flp pilus assembly CpaF family ATPase